ncbi:glycosyltransferase [Streptomyces sp. NPDC057638]|uniref:glycosyltransferase n=1 Tax=Streptomyces sp. NPDC057638 TaxID=3346190 RepID=UPI0036A4EB30
MLTESGYARASGEFEAWWGQLAHGLVQHDFTVYAVADGTARGGLAERACPTGGGRAEVRAGRAYGRRERRRFLAHFEELLSALPAGAATPEETHGAPGAHGARDGRGGWDGRDGSARVSGGRGVAGSTGIPGFAGADETDPFTRGLHGLADLAVGHGGLTAALRSESALSAIERLCRTPGVRGAYGATASLRDCLALADAFARALRPLSYDWYGDDGLAAVDLCHATAAGSGALPGLLAKRFFGVPLLVTEYDVLLRRHCLTVAASGANPVVRALLTGFGFRLATAVYRAAALVTPGDGHARRWQLRCGADPARVRIISPGVAAGARGTAVPGGGPGLAAAVRAPADLPAGSGSGFWSGSVGAGGPGPAGTRGEGTGWGGVPGPAPGCGDEGDRPYPAGAGEYGGDPRTLVWTGRFRPGQDLATLLHAFAEVRAEEPGALLRLVAPPARGPVEARCRAGAESLVSHLFPGPGGGRAAVTLVDRRTLGARGLAEVYASGVAVVMSSVDEGFPLGVVEAMFHGRATVSTDVGAVAEAVGGTGLIVPPRDPRALADRCLALVRDPARAARLGGAARSRALELFTVERQLAAFHRAYLELISHSPVHREPTGARGEPVLFARPPEEWVPLGWRRDAPGGTTPGRSHGAASIAGCGVSLVAARAGGAA